MSNFLGCLPGPAGLAAKRPSRQASGQGDAEQCCRPHRAGQSSSQQGLAASSPDTQPSLARPSPSAGSPCRGQDGWGAAQLIPSGKQEGHFENTELVSAATMFAACVPSNSAGAFLSESGWSPCVRLISLASGERRNWGPREFL